MESASLSIGITALILVIALTSCGIFIALASKRSVHGGKILVATVLPIAAIFVVPNLLSALTGGKAALLETIPWVAPLALAAPYIWLRWRTLSGAGNKQTAAPPPKPRPPPSQKANRQNAQAPAKPAEPAAHAKSPTIFISYRRDDSADVTGRLYDRLTTAFGREHVYKDVDSIPLGVDFREHINALVGTCDVVLAVIGRQWLNVSGGNDSRRLDDETDPVRLEIVAALSRKIPVVPVLVGGSKIPPAEALPDDIKNLAFRNGTSVRPDPDFHKDVDRLIAGLRGQ